jgi:amidophosphoribosyltransferase
LCTACFTGQYPIPLPAPELLGKHMLEGISRAVETEAGSPDPSPDSPYQRLLPGGGAEDALLRP